MVDGAAELLWTYCVLHSPAAPPGASALGPVRVVERGALSALVTPVPQADYCADALRRNLNEFAWLERVARAHEAVLEEAMTAGPVIPMRLCTLFETEDGVAGMLEHEAPSLTAALEAVDGRQELGVKVLVDPDRLAAVAGAASAEVAGYERQMRESSEAGAYMLRRRLERHLRDLSRARAHEIATAVHVQLAERAIGAVTHRPQNRELSHHEGEMILNAAYLVEARRAEEMRSLASDLGRDLVEVGGRVELTGPWPPYNFVPQGTGSAR